MKKAALTILILATFNYLYSNQTNKDMSNIGKSNPSYKHGEALRKNHTKEYLVWCSIKARCYNKNYRQFKDYGGRGITVCDRWLNSYEAFLEDIGRAPSPKHSIDRKDNDGNYEPSNCKWATKYEQARNTTQNRFITHNGVTKCITDWARSLGGQPSLIHYRLNSGWSIEMALTTPLKKNQYAFKTKD